MNCTLAPTGSSRSGFKTARICYILALALIAALVVATHLTIVLILERQEATARIINMAGRQRMLSQRIAKEAVWIAYSKESDQRAAAKVDLENSLDEMETAFLALSRGGSGLGIPSGMSAAEMAIYKDSPERLEERMIAFLKLGRSYLATEPEKMKVSHELTSLLDLAEGPLLHALDAVVSQREVDSEAAVNFLRQSLIGALCFTLLSLVAEALFIFRPLFRNLESVQKQLLHAALTDPLTGSKNRRCFMELAAHEVERSHRTMRPLGVAMLDIDKFKSINDTRGHAVGDEAIKTLVRTILSSTRSTDILGRVGGEEFALLLPDTPDEAAVAVVEKLRELVESTPVNAGDSPFNLTISIGLAMLDKVDDGIATALDRADQALYQAKQTGRNRVVVKKV